MTPSPSPLLTAAEPTSAELVASRQALLSQGYDIAGDDVVGRCLADCTLFIEFDAAAGLVRSWILDINTFEFLGKTYEVRGPWAAAAEQARHLIEQGYAQERLSGGLERFTHQEPEPVSVA